MLTTFLPVTRQKRQFFVGENPNHAKMAVHSARSVVAKATKVPMKVCILWEVHHYRTSNAYAYFTLKSTKNKWRRPEVRSGIYSNDV